MTSGQYFRRSAAAGWRAGLWASVAVLSAGGVSSAQEAPQSPLEAEVVEVHGLAADDMLNLRATASPGGMLIARVAVGTLLRNHGCTDVAGNEWCKVSQMDNGSVMGWAAARYLLPTEAAPPAAE